MTVLWDLFIHLSLEDFIDRTILTVPSPSLRLRHRHLPSTPRLSNYTSSPPISYKKETFSMTILNIVLDRPYTLFTFAFLT